MYLKQIEQLVILQRIDSEMIGLLDEFEQAQQEVEALEAQFAALDERRATSQEKIDHLKEQDKRLGNEIEEDDLRIKKSKNKLMMASNNKEYHAMMREVDNMEKHNRMREEEKLALDEELKRQEQGMESIMEEVGELSGVLDEKRANLDARVKAAKDKLASLESQRGKAGKEVPAPVLGRYEFIRSRLVPPVIVPVDQGVCSGCHIAIPPQNFIELQKGEQILSCPNCQRLIYWCNHFTPEVCPV